MSADERLKWESFVTPNLLGGDAGNFSFSVGRIKIGATDVFPTSNGVTALVGGNNVGKSATLMQLLEFIGDASGIPAAPKTVVKGIDLRKRGTSADLAAWLGVHSRFVSSQSSGTGFTHVGDGNLIAVDSAGMYWADYGANTVGGVWPWLVHYSDAARRLGMVQGTAQRRDISMHPAHPLHFLQDDAELLREFSELSERVFRQPLVLDRLSMETRLRVGAVSSPPPPIDAVSTEYTAELSKLPNLFDQGDGMKSLLGLLLPVMVGAYPVIIVDEPEAFLHPPQAFEAGRILANVAKDKQVQVIVATHDKNFLAGLLDAGVDVSVVRLERSGDETTAFQLHADELKELWRDPVLRYSNVLDGVFHRLVVIAEADPDCKFFAATLNDMEDEVELVAPANEVHFVPSNGKAGMAKMVSALRAVRVDVVATPDLDVLNDASLLKALVEAAGGDWGHIKPIYDRSTAHLQKRSTGATCGQVLALISAELERQQGSPWTQEVRDSLAPLMRTTQSPWDEVKKHGIAAFTGQSRQELKKLLLELEAIGIKCVEKGELERLAPDVTTSKGPRWLADALSAGAHKELAAREHVTRLVSSLLTTASENEPR
ncbi:AAA family ATPase [Kribbella deserti]|uniref:AAA family ATPase n=1 Tax=Kribbella deserti TaxID=1926257 RepID=A0ABV6QFK9_9ACTN